jgi:tRNA G18 (ribose-2'-O)-methylase SpoU
MPITPTITSPHNRRVVHARKLRLRKYRQQQGRFLVEGVQLLQMALDAGLQPLEVFCCEGGWRDPTIQTLLSRFRDANAERLTVSPTVMQTLSAAAGNIYARGLHFASGDIEKSSAARLSQSIIATFAQFQRSLPSIYLADDELVLVHVSVNS